MDEKILILLGLGAIGYLTATSFNDDDDEIENVIKVDVDCGKQNMKYNHEFYQPTSGMSNTNPTISYTNYPKFNENENVSPLSYGQMIQENYVPSDYINVNEYTNNPDQIPVYDEKTGNVGLPVSDMTDLAVGEDNKYIYDRTIGSVGFTSTKIGGRRRGQADYIRGDLPILPDRGAWFQVSPDINNTLLDGALGNQNALSSSVDTATSNGGSGQVSEGYYETPSKKTKKTKGQQAMRTVLTEQGENLGACEDTSPDYVDCIYDKFKKTGRQPNMSELKRMYALQQQTINRDYVGATPSVPPSNY
uniref:Uncharacterized protein n=1 Tax=viral metagenome TaxID=1070528 RepID=A0A6C0DZZ8_9ZZZZ